MKRYFVFAYDRYYPAGGWNDFQESFITLDEAQTFATSLTDNKTFDRAHVVDIVTGATIN